MKFLHPPPREVAIAFCRVCGDVQFAVHVNQLNAIADKHCDACRPKRGTPRPLLQVLRYQIVVSK